MPDLTPKREVHESTLSEISQRVLWLAVRMVDHANRGNGPSGQKVGGHQASSASMVNLMVALWFGYLGRDDWVAVKPHASPVYHAIQYLLGQLDRTYLTKLRAFGGLQAYPSRTKDPDNVDFSTGSVGLGAVAPLCAAAVARYLCRRGADVSPGRFIALVGDAELDEGNVWEALADPSLQDLGNVLWVVDLNRQSLDRVVPGIKVDQIARQFEACGWNVIKAKYGRRLQEVFETPGGDALRRHIDEMPNEKYQACFGLEGPVLRDQFLAEADPSVKQLLEDVPDADLAGLVQDLGGHDFTELLDAYRAADKDPRPSVIFAYTIKGWGLPFAGQRLNHAALMSGAQIDALRAELGLTAVDEWDAFEPGTSAFDLCRATAARLTLAAATRAPAETKSRVEVGLRTDRPLSTQEAFGRLLVQLSKDPQLSRRVVTASPDVAISTNLGGWINKVGVFAPEETVAIDNGELLEWRPNPRGQHIELGISEMNLFLLLGQLGLAGEVHGEQLVPIGTVYDPFVCRGLDALIYSLYSGARFIIAGTPSGITLASEGGAHQSTITPGIGIELPEIAYAEPAYAVALDWLLCDAISDIARGQGQSMYLRLTTRPIDQAPFKAVRERLGDQVLRAQVLRGAYRLYSSSTPGSAARVTLCATGAVMPETLRAAQVLEDEGVAPLVLDVTSPGRLYREWSQTLRENVRTARDGGSKGLLTRLIEPVERDAPIVTVQDGSSHALSWVGSVFGAPVVPLGVDGFGESGGMHDLYNAHDLTAGAIVNAALRALGNRS